MGSRDHHGVDAPTPAVDEAPAPLYSRERDERIAQLEARTERSNNFGLPTNPSGGFLPPDRGQRAQLEQAERRNPDEARRLRRWMRDDYVSQRVEALDRMLVASRSAHGRTCRPPSLRHRQRRGSCGRPRGRAKTSSAARAGPSDRAEGDGGDDPPAPGPKHQLAAKLPAGAVAS